MKFTIDKGTWIVALVSALLLTAATLAVSAQGPLSPEPGGLERLQ